MMPRRPHRLAYFRALRAAVVGCMLSGCGTAGFNAAPSSAASGRIEGIDHIVLGFRDLQRGMEECKRATGIEPAAGGVYPDLGVADGLLSLGTHAFLEVLAPDPSGKATALHFQPLHSYTRLAPFGWVMGVTDIDGLRSRMSARGVRTSVPERGRHDQPDGTRLEWRSMSIVAPADPLLPTFIEWDAGSPHPGAASPPGCLLHSLVLETPTPDALEATLQLLGVAVEVVEAPRARMVVRLSCGGRDIEFR
jgi:hypothetical protein